MSVLEPDVAGRQCLLPGVDDEGVDVVLEPARNHEQELVDFVRSAMDPLYRMAYLPCGDPHRAEDLVQQTFERTWRSWWSARNGDPLASGPRRVGGHNGGQVER